MVFVEDEQEECVTPAAFLSCGVKGQIGIQLSAERLNHGHHGNILYKQEDKGHRKSADSLTTR